MRSVSNKRFRYMMQDDVYEQEKDRLRRQCNNQVFGRQQVCIYLRDHGFHLDEIEVAQLADLLFRKEHGFTAEQVVGLFARLRLDEQIEKQLKSVFYFLSGGQEMLGAMQLRAGLARLGQTVKDVQINKMLKQMDMNGNGFLTFQIFLQAMLIE